MICWTMQESYDDFYKCHCYIANGLTCDPNSSIHLNCLWPCWHQTLILWYCLSLIGISPLFAWASIDVMTNCWAVAILVAAAAAALVALSCLVASDLYCKIDVFPFHSYINSYYYSHDLMNGDAIYYFDFRMYCCMIQRLMLEFDVVSVMMKLMNYDHHVPMYDCDRKCCHRYSHSSFRLCVGLRTMASLN